MVLLIWRAISEDGARIVRAFTRTWAYAAYCYRNRGSSVTAGPPRAASAPSFRTNSLRQIDHRILARHRALTLVSCVEPEGRAHQDGSPSLNGSTRLVAPPKQNSRDCVTNLLPSRF